MSRPEKQLTDQKWGTLAVTQRDESLDPTFVQSESGRWHPASRLDRYAQDPEAVILRAQENLARLMREAPPRKRRVYKALLIQHLIRLGSGYTAYVVAARCRLCGKLFETAVTGRPRLTCSDRCRQILRRRRLSRNRGAIGGDVSGEPDPKR